MGTAENMQKKITRLVGSMGVCLLMIGRVPAILWELLEREREGENQQEKVEFKCSRFTI